MAALIFDIALAILGWFVGLYVAQIGKFWDCTYTRRGKIFRTVLATLLSITGLIGVCYAFASPPPFSQPAANAPPPFAKNDWRSAMYVGNGCFWHTQYDTVVLEQDASGPFGGRSDANVTSLVGYAGGHFKSPGAAGTACYHGIPGTDYGKLGHSEAVSVVIDPSSHRAQVYALALLYFDHGFVSVSCEAGDLGCVNGQRRQRLDPQDYGPMYRNVIGFPGGIDNSSWMEMVRLANNHSMPLVRGEGGPSSDKEGEYIVYVYDSTLFPFFRGEAHHQFHPNTVWLTHAVPTLSAHCNATLTACVFIVRACHAGDRPVSARIVHQGAQGRANSGGALGYRQWLLRPAALLDDYISLGGVVAAAAWCWHGDWVSAVR